MRARPALPRLLGLLLASAAAAAAAAAPCVLARAAGGGRLRVQASDGRELLSAAWAPRAPGGLSECRVSAEPREVAAFLERCAAGEGRPGPRGGPVFSDLAEAKAACSGFGSAARRRRGKRGLTYPGTLWCGAGSIAESYEALGEHRETDRCCREHDHCPHLIHPFTAKYGYRNFRFHTVSHCDCDNRLKACLRAVNDTASRVVGQAFFNVIQVPCFEFTYKEQCVEPYLYVWCKNYSTVAVAVLQEPVLYDYGGGLIDGPAMRPPPAGAPPTAPPPDGRLRPTTAAPAPPHKPESSGGPQKHRKGKAKGKARKGRKGKGARKPRRKPRPAGGREPGTAPPKWLAARERGKADVQAPAGLPRAAEADPYNAVLGDDPRGGEGPPGADGGGEPAPARATAGPSSARPTRRRKSRSGRRPWGEAAPSRPSLAS